MHNQNKIAIVTGAGSGIGRATAIALNKEGWITVLAGRKQEQLTETAKACDNSRIRIIPTDIIEQQSVIKLFSQALKAYGRLDLLFNNAGVSPPSKLFEELTLDEWQTVINTNLTGAFLCAQEAVKIMKQQTPIGGRIINNGSLAAHVPRPNSAPYAASKHGITGLTKSISLDGRAFNITCGQIDIGNAASEMTKKQEAGILQADGSHKMEPTMDVNDVARAVLYMAGLPLDANVPFLTVMANQMPYIGRG
jgi:NAD(P)-dependent dehydrogenase (short-subunit alcohol dehydrogenase family)